MDKPELETLDYKSANASPEVKRISNPIIWPGTRAKNSVNPGQGPEQPNTNAMIIKTIQGLITCVNDNLGKLNELAEDGNYLAQKGLEEIDLFEKTTLFDLQKEFEWTLNKHYSLHTI